MGGVLRIIRMILIGVCMVAGAILCAAYSDKALEWLATAVLRWPPNEVPNFRALPIQIGMILVGTFAGAIIGHEFAMLLSHIGDKIEEMETDERISVVIGTILGIGISGFLWPLLLRVNVLGPILAILTSVVMILVFIIGINSLRVGLPWSPGQPSAKKRNIRILDTNVIIDGRIGEIVKTGFLGGQIYVPGFVLDELQAIADSADSLKRARGRRGLDILNSMQKDNIVEVRIHDKLAPDGGDGVDPRLVRLAKALNCDVVTNDFNLGKVAELEGIRVLNVNDLALAMKPNVLPGEEMTVTVMREGKEPGQGVAYLNDGTMVVVEDGYAEIGNSLCVLVTSVIQTVAGKMIFAVPNREGGDGAAHDIRSSAGRRPRR